MIKFIDGSFKLLWIFVVVSLCWQLLELIMIGKTNPNNVDTVVGIILSLSLYKNFENQKWFKGEEIN
jgi:uncharacterized membrane protein